MSCNSGGARALAALVCGVVLAACDDAPSEQAATATSTTSKAAPSKVPGLPAEMVAAVSAGKTANVISVHFALDATPKLNKALPVRIAIVPHQEFISVRAYFEAHDGLVLGSGDKLGPLANARVEKPIEHQLVVVPVRDGVFMITATVDTEGTEGSVTRVFSIPVIISPPDEAATVPSAPAAPQAPATAAPEG